MRRHFTANSLYNSVSAPKSETNAIGQTWKSIVAINKNTVPTNTEIQTVNNGYKWYPHHKGGEYRRWYGNQEYVINWKSDGYEIKNYRDASEKLLSRP